MPLIALSEFIASRSIDDSRVNDAKSGTCDVDETPRLRGGISPVHNPYFP
jgi:hypothetical protein